MGKKEWSSNREPYPTPDLKIRGAAYLASGDLSSECFAKKQEFCDIDSLQRNFS
jgi:hypothetical protein